MTKRFLFLALLIYALFLAAALTRNGTLALIAVPFLVYLITGTLLSPGSLTVDAHRNLSKYSTEPSSPVEVSVSLENQGSTALNLRFGDELLPNMELLDGQSFQNVLLSFDENVELKYTFAAQRGCYAWENIEVIASDPFGLIELRRHIPAAGEVLVLPKTTRLKHIPVRPYHTLHSSGPIPARRGGSGTDFWGVRTYRPGDPLRWLQWKMTARHPNQFFTKEFEQEEIADIGLILDARSLTDHVNGNDTLFEHAASACASLAELFMREGNRVGLMIYGDKLPCLPPGYGKLQLNRILAELARATPGSNFTLDSLKNLPVRLFPSRAVLVFISPLGEHDVQILARLRGNGYQIILVSPDPVDYAFSNARKELSYRLAFRAARLERIAQLKQLVRMGVQVVDWQVGNSLSNTLLAALNQVGGERRRI